MGHWVPRASAPALRRAFPSVGTLDRKALDEVKRAASVRNLHDGVRYLACPFCGERMDRRQFALGSGIVIDRCLSDGVWFDGGELELARAYFAAGGPHEEVARKRRESKDGGAPIPTNPAGGVVPSPMVELLLWLMN